MAMPERDLSLSRLRFTLQGRFCAGPLCGLWRLPLLSSEEFRDR